MLKNVNQSIVNRSIAGGVACKCISGGSNGSDVNGGKITDVFTIYEVEETSEENPPTTTTEWYIKKDDAERMFNAILNLDPEKYTFYQIAYQDSNSELESININVCPCIYIYTAYTNVDVFTQQNKITFDNNRLNVTILRRDGNVVYDGSAIIGYSIVDALPGTLVSESIYKFTLYYREL